MEYEIVRKAKAAAGRGTALPLRNLPISEEVDGQLIGDDIFLKGKTMAQVNPMVRKQAKAASVEVALRTVDEKDKKGVYVFRIRKSPAKK